MFVVMLRNELVRAGVGVEGRGWIYVSIIFTNKLLRKQFEW